MQCSYQVETKHGVSEAGWTLPQPAHPPGMRVSAPPPPGALQFGETWTPGLSALDQTCLYSLVSVIASNDRRYRKPRWLWSLINTAGSGWGVRGPGLGSGVLDTPEPTSPGQGPRNHGDIRGCVRIY